MLETLLFEQTRAEQNGNDKQRKENKEQNFCNRSGTLCNTTEAEYGCDNCNNKEDH
jgi:hypothetical protein